MVRFGSIWVSSPFLGEHILGVESGMGLGHSVWVSDLRSVLLGLHLVELFLSYTTVLVSPHPKCHDFV